MRKGATLVGSLVAIFILSSAFVSLLNLQAGIIKAKYNKEYDNTANLLMSEGLEVVRAIYQSNLNSPAGSLWNDGLSNGTYTVDYNTNISTGLTTSLRTTCDVYTNPTTPTLNNTCSLVQNISTGYTIGNGNILYRYITIQADTINPDRIKVKSTVIVKNPRNLNKIKTYSADMELFNINK